MGVLRRITAFFGGRPSDEVLYIILPYFNYCKFLRRKQLFVEFVERVGKIKNIRIVVVEATEKGSEYDLPLMNVFQHFRYEVNHRLWIKENLINLGFEQLPNDWKYAAWVDADITFLNETWVTDTIRTLQKYDVAQMFQSCINLGPEGESIKIDQSFAYQNLRSGHPYHRAYKYGFWHPGYAWAVSRKAYAAMDGLVDWAILGSGDRHMALALIGKVECSHPGNIHPEYGRMLKQYQEKCKGLKLGYTPGTILHHWHGRLEDRKYRERWDILTKGQYDPSLDIHKDGIGLLQLSKSGMRLKEEISEYFVGRNEDSIRK
jgi:hypothetical protein